VSTLSMANAAKTHCPHGHPYDASNTGRARRGFRYCKSCRQERARRQAEAKRAARPPTPSDAERFWVRVNKSSGHFWNGSECWEWTAGTSKGYGTFTPRHGRAGTAHRWAYEQAYGPTAPGYQVHHQCEKTVCVRPDHLLSVTPKRNCQLTSYRTPRDNTVIRDRQRQPRGLRPETLSFCAPADVREALEIYVATHKLSRSRVISDAVRAFLGLVPWERTA
jgi:hypothetical protein